ncbi:helicase HerA domain-containing protein [Rhodococcus koreensis]|uniref:helicase HerA domain-containing protein n=1 Tax=Rhodococcus koreensis TaxID=99653 RepID=UPI0019826C12|nr:DUF87 domain-containing protein [Rhodococcus koreensis]QSE87010.1 hypothetical protein JWS14_49445 [Rhodococcus koreensis]
MKLTTPWRNAADNTDPSAATHTARSAAQRQRCEDIESSAPLLDDTERAELQREAQSGNVVARMRAEMHLRRDAQARSQTVAGNQHAETLRGDHRGLSGAGGGKAGPILPLTEFRATTPKAAGFWPFPVGAGAPIVGVPLGQHLYTQAPVCFDPLSWMTRARFLQQPSMMLLGLPGFGKSTLARKLILGMIYAGVSCLVLGDMRPDYRKLTELIREDVGPERAQVVELGRGGKINPLDMGPLAQILPTLESAGTEIAAKTAALVQSRIRNDRLRRVTTLLQLTRGKKEIKDFEISALRAAMRELDDQFTDGTQPVLEDLEAILERGSERLRDAFKSDTAQEYRKDSKKLRRTLHALIEGEFGDVFNGQTTDPINVDAAMVCVDVSGVATSDRKLKGAVLLACWEHGFAATEAAHYLADAECGPKRNFMVILDEMWQVLRAGVGMVDRVDELTRLNRAWGTVLLMCTHTIGDLRSLARKADVQTAQGLVERAAALVVGALPRAEMRRLSEIKPFTDTEVADITSWSSPSALTGESGSMSAPPGQGKFIIKIGEQGAPGIPMQTVLMPSEIESGVHDTNYRYTFAGDSDEYYDEAA